MKKLIFALVLALLVGVSAALGQCREAGSIKFQRGLTNATVTGTVTSAKAICYRFRALAGQTVTASLKSPSTRARFSIAPDAEDADLAVTDTTSYVGKLESNYGDKYILSIHVPKGSASYTLKVEIK